jgi:hypothetical protein
MRDELLDREIFTTLEEAKILIEQWRKEYIRCVLIALWVTTRLLLRLC